MLTLHPSIRIYVCLRPADMRKSMDGLSVMVRAEMGEEPLSGKRLLSDMLIRPLDRAPMPRS